jgi:hypothetical protein
VIQPIGLIGRWVAVLGGKRRATPGTGRPVPPAYSQDNFMRPNPAERQNCPIEHGGCKGLARPIVNEVSVGEGYLLSFEQMDLDRVPTAGQI